MAENANMKRSLYLAFASLCVLIVGLIAKSMGEDFGNKLIVASIFGLFISLFIFVKDLFDYKRKSKR